MDYKYSLIIPHYNIPALLERLLTSVPKRDDLQIIVIDDCSDESNQSSLKQLATRFPKVEFLSTGTNGGGGKARNIGLDHAKGEFLIFADADDYFAPAFNEFLDTIFTDDLTIFNAQGIYEESKEPSSRVEHVGKQIQAYLTGQKDGELQLRYLFGEPWGKIIRRGLVERNNIRFDETPIHNDTLFSYMVGYHAKTLKAYPEVYYFVSDRLSSVSKAINWNNLTVRTHVFARKTKFLLDKNIPVFDQILITPLIIYIKHIKFKKISEYMKIIASEGVAKSYVVKHLFAKIFNKLTHRK